MTQYKRKKDIISEQEYNQQMSSLSSLPEDDSPGDSEGDADAEFKMGLNFNSENDEGLGDGAEVVNTEEEFLAGDDFINGDNSAVEKEIAAVDRSVWSREKRHPVKTIPDSAKVVSSEMPSPWMDAEKQSDTH